MKRANISRTRIPIPQNQKDAEERRRKLMTNVSAIGLSQQVVNQLQGVNIYTVGDLLNKTSDQLLLINGFGEKSLEEVFKALAKIGFERKKKNQS